MTFIIMQNTTKRLSAWATIVALILLIPLVLTLLGSGVDGEGWHWTLSDFVFAFFLLFSAGLTYELVARKMNSTAYRVAVGIAVATALLLVWFNAAVGIVGDSPGPMFFGVVVVLIFGAVIARFRPQGMARALFATALAQALVAVIAMIAWGQYVEISILNGFFIALWIGSALLFRRTSAMDPT